jgi:Rho-binding antiterminator
MVTYRPINCEFHDVLESCATLRKAVHIDSVLSNGTNQSRHVVIADLYSRGGAEYLILDDGETIRLDALLSVDGRGVDGRSLPVGARDRRS